MYGLETGVGPLKKADSLVKPSLEVSGIISWNKCPILLMQLGNRNEEFDWKA